MSILIEFLPIAFTHSLTNTSALLHIHFHSVIGPLIGTLEALIFEFLFSYKSMIEKGLEIVLGKQQVGADAIIDFVNASKTVETDMQLSRRRTRLVLVGLFGGELKLSLITMPTRAYKIIGSYTGSISEMIELVSLAKRGVVKPIVSERFKLDQATEALSKLKDGKITGRGVINP